jgi:hypothetical protein
MKEKDIQKVKTERRLSYPEAGRLVEGNTPSPTTMSYAAAVKPTIRTIKCQTELMWLTGEKPSSFTPVLNPKPTRQNKFSISVQTMVEPSLEKVVKNQNK